MSRSKLLTVLFVLVFAFGLFLPPSSRAAIDPATQNFVQNRRIVIDPGHGGSDPGTTQCSTLVEKAATLQIALIVEKILRDRGAVVKLTRYGDVTMSNRERADVANGANGEAFISVHLNGSTDHSINRTLTMWGKREKDLEFSRTIHAAQLANLQPIGDEGVRQFASRVLLSSNMPATISESVYLSHTQECQALTAGAAQFETQGTWAGTRQEQIAEALFYGLNEWFRTHR